MKEERNIERNSIKCGNVTDGFDKLQDICKKEAEKLLATIDVPDNKVVSVPFWTSDIPELIGVAKFIRNEDGNIVYDLDFSESTL